ncbi:MAG: type I restriction enzyme HsdR N-terminal domain-containing protein, partial [Bacteroidota bacterium]|nr:type I restriction enzyme HsdR N-terminal domain-containing protein [Bacteroidota bacterium]
RLNGLVRRCDTVLYDKELQPLVIVEYKAPSVAITQKVFEQVTTYNWALRVRYLIVSNGLVNYCCSVDYEAQRVDFLSEIPDYAQLK